ncbi:hypothetical protein SEVIR_5G123300v4 [Setaria viridis]|uniref:Peptidase A1 domain-containing protein n=2 Tax=Setaria TaxID=4554 RepID=K3XHR0_SETIT|nr:aspartic proteinase CDR1 [Setaria italica]XP_034596896.1 aspartic proteinase CDR1-like isoform X1 [Setaria viridis]RCV24937.1 hypothetical protein SETIT_5G126300v2 [Setaria italica]TKW13783.1 hypothetical protein SEVIR_5G123300v2 [Setaria viridis]
MEATALVLFALLVLAGQRACAASDAGGGGFRVEFIHRDSARSPFHDPALSPHDRLLAAARRSLRGEVLGRSVLAAAPAPAADSGVESKIISRSFEYLMAVNVGTPPTQMLAIADTGSDLVWVNCRNGSGAAAAAGGVFAPSRSSTYEVVSCRSDACQGLNQASCDSASNCQYQYGYGDGSRTVGVLSTETFTFVDGGARQVQVPHVDFGCSTYMAGTFRADGLVGLGAGAFSLVSQLGSATSFGRRFSYCLIPSSAGANSSSTLNFGSRAVVSEPGAAKTPLVPGEVDTYYTVALESVAVGGRAVASNESAIIVDSGTTLTFLDPALLQPLVAELGRRINLTRAQPPEQLLEVCYDVSGRAQEDWGIPDVTLRFGGGGDVTLRPENTFVMVQEGTLCLALVPVSEATPVSILGNIAQQNLHVGYDLDARTVTFAAADCTRSSSASSSS